MRDLLSVAVIVIVLACILHHCVEADNNNYKAGLSSSDTVKDTIR